MSQRDRAEKKVRDKHGSASSHTSPGKAPHRPGGHSDGVNTEQRKANQRKAKKAKRARRRLDHEIINGALHENFTVSACGICEKLTLVDLERGLCGVCRGRGAEEDWA